MTEAICKDCGHYFIEVVVFGIGECPKCGSGNTKPTGTICEEPESQWSTNARH